jgi:hypothetical protein
MKWMIIFPEPSAGSGGSGGGGGRGGGGGSGARPPAAGGGGGGGIRLTLGIRQAVFPILNLAVGNFGSGSGYSDMIFSRLWIRIKTW